MRGDRRAAIATVALLVSVLTACDDESNGGGGGSDACEAGATRCQSALLQRCADGAFVTESDCAEAAGACAVGSCETSGCVTTPIADDTACDDADRCTSNDVCTTGVCAGQEVLCSGSADACNTAACDPADGSCVRTPRVDDTACDDGAACTTGDACHAGLCAGTPVECDDGLGCTSDACDPSDGSCTHDPSTCACGTDADCDDSNACTGVERCDPLTFACLGGAPVDCSHLATDCRIAACDPADGTCDVAPVDDGLACDDGDACTVTDLCASGVCLGAGAPDCDDQVDCTVDSCVPASGCVHVPDDLACEDGGCTIDVCNPVAGCTHVSSDALCDDGLGCTLDTCDGAGTCVWVAAGPQVACVGVCFDPWTPLPQGCGLTNGSFEAGDLSGWGVKDLAQPYDAVRVLPVGSGTNWLTTAPTDGNYSAINGFDGCGPDTVELWQAFEVPIASTVTLAFDWRAGWNNSGALPRVFRVQLEPAAGGPPLQTFEIVVAPAGSNQPTMEGQSAAIDLLPYAGQSILVRFVWEVPECFTGPAGFEIDAVRIVLPCDLRCDGVCFDPTLPVPAPCQVRNGSFETGDLAEWTPFDLGMPYYPLSVVPTGTVGPMVEALGVTVNFVTAATDGGFSVLNGFDANDPGQIGLAQELTLPVAGSVRLAFDWRCGWNLLDFGGGTLPRTFRLDVEPIGGGAPLLSTLLLEALPQTKTLDTGPMLGDVNLDPVAGQAVRLRFVWDVPEASTGPAACELDRVRLIAQ